MALLVLGARKQKKVAYWDRLAVDVCLVQLLQLCVLQARLFVTFLGHFSKHFVEEANQSDG